MYNYFVHEQGDWWRSNGVSGAIERPGPTQPWQVDIMPTRLRHCPRLRNRSKPADTRCMLKLEITVKGSLNVC
jgi:hypothetical protein